MQRLIPETLHQGIEIIERDDFVGLPGVLELGGVIFDRWRADKAMIGSCTNGGYDDLLAAALVIRAARALGLTKAARELLIFPGSLGVRERIEVAESRLGGESVAGVFRSIGGNIRQSWCGPCFGQGPDGVARPWRHRPRRHDHSARPAHGGVSVASAIRPHVS